MGGFESRLPLHSLNTGQSSPNQLLPILSPCGVDKDDGRIDREGAPTLLPHPDQAEPQGRIEV